LYAAGTDPEPECGFDVCNGANACSCSDSLHNFLETDVDCGGALCPSCGDGSTCSVGSDCTSTNCIDGYCCDTGCGTDCEACDISGSEGSCTDHDNGTDPEGDCQSGELCNGTGTCVVHCGAISCTGDGDCTPGATGGLCAETTGDCLQSICVGAVAPVSIEVGAPITANFGTWQAEANDADRGQQRWYCNATLPVSANGVLTDWELFVNADAGNGEVAQLAVIRCTGGGGGTGPALNGCIRVGLGPLQSVTNAEGSYLFTLAGSTQLDGATPDATGIVAQAGDYICADGDRYNIAVDCDGTPAAGGCPGADLDTQRLNGMDVAGEPFTLENNPSNGVLMIRAWGTDPGTPGLCSDTELEVDTTLCSIGGDTCCSGVCTNGPSGPGTCS